MLVWNKPQLRFWIPALWITRVTQFYTYCNDTVSSMGPTAPSISKAILKHDILLMWLALWHTDIIQEISHLIKITQWSDFFPTTSLNQSHYSWTACGFKNQELILTCIYIDTHTHTKKPNRFFQSSTLKRCWKTDFIYRLCHTSYWKQKIITNHNQKHC